MQNKVLLRKWLWELESKPRGLWASTLTRLYGVTTASQLTAHADESSFLKELASLLPFYSVSVRRDNELTWRWNTSGQFTCASAYRATHHRGIISHDYQILWKLWVPMKVRIFVWLMRENKILTQKILLIRGCSIQLKCRLCNSTIVETT